MIYQTKLEEQADQMEEVLAAHMEDKALSFLKSKVAHQVGALLHSAFGLWKDEAHQSKQQRVEEEMNSMLDTQMEARALGFLKQKLAQSASKACLAAWSLWYAMYMEAVEVKKQEELEEMLML